MTPNDVLEALATIRDTTKPDDQSHGVLSLASIPHKLKVGWNDAAAAKLILWIQEQWPEITEGQTEGVLLAALWWTQYWSSISE